MKPFRRVLRAAEPEVMVQLVRLVILYEDLKLEMAGLHVPKDKDFDEVSRHYREMYFIRRAFATLWEIDNAIRRLEMLPQFKTRKTDFEERRLKDWMAAVKFFSKVKKFIDNQRNAYGGHITDDVAKHILSKVEAAGARVARITLHVGFGTFQPVRVDEVEAHRMQRERYSIPEQTALVLKERRVLAVGTTTLRALETFALTGQREGETELFVYPGFQFQVVERLLTNFHLPKSTLFMLVCAFAGKERILEAYRHAIEQRYRFFSYGDAMLIERCTSG